MSAFAEGDLVLVDYGDTPRLWHMRLLLSVVRGTELMIATPDLDLYPEDISMSNPDLSAIRAARPSITDAAVCGFSEQTTEMRAELMTEGRRLAAAAATRRSLRRGSGRALRRMDRWWRP